MSRQITSPQTSRLRQKWLIYVIAAAWVAVVMIGYDTAISSAQQGAQPLDASDLEELVGQNDEQSDATPNDSPSGIDVLTLIVRGGSFMIPIALMSLLVVTLAVERMISLRTVKIMPPNFVQRLQDLATPINRFNPSAAYQVCLDYQCSASRVISSMLMRTGQPLGEVERTASESIQREADQHAGPIRWLTLAAAATPLMGLLGTVWGMIVAFHESTTLTADRSRSEQLSEGIYTALVTTLSGLIVAIPAAILALYLENRLSKLFHQVEEFAFEIAPGLDRFKGRRRLDTDGTLHAIEGSSAKATPSDAPQPPPPPRQPSHGSVKAG